MSFKPFPKADSAEEDRLVSGKTRTNAIPEGFMGILPENQPVFHWHGDTFELPGNAVHLYFSNACRNQAFLYKDRALGLQFHLETTFESAMPLIQNCRNELVQGPSIQTEHEIIEGIEKLAGINGNMDRFLEYMSSF
ncbi:MAG: hypothetical protein ABIJ50_11525 [Pseudomonadota bacterium]